MRMDMLEAGKIVQERFRTQVQRSAQTLSNFTIAELFIIIVIKDFFLKNLFYFSFSR